MKTSTRQILTSVIIITVSCFAVNAQTNVSGGIYANTTWTKANSPYIVTDTVVVFPSVTLTIEPGVTVKFYDGKYMEIRQGTLIALGTATDSITFTSNSGSPHSGIWKGILFTNATNMQTDYCIYKYADKILNTRGSNLNLTIQHSSFYSNNICVDNYNPVTIRLSSFYNNVQCIADIAQGLHMDSCFFINNQQCTYEAATIVTNSSFIGNSTGLLLSDVGSHSVKNCIFCNNGIGCINQHLPGYKFGDPADTLMNCNFSQNHIGLSVPANFGYVKGNVFTDNDTAYYDNYFTKYDSILNNYIYHNKVGFVSRSSFSTISKNNNICNNTLYNLQYGGTLNAIFSNICWCDTDSVTIRSKIYDGYKNIAYGLVNFSPFVSCDSSVILALPPINCPAIITTGVEEIPHHSIAGVFEIYPNPASDHLTVELKANSSKTEIKIFNMLGELAYTSTATRQKTTIDISNLKSGIYIIQVATADGLSRQKFIRE